MELPKVPPCQRCGRELELATLISAFGIPVGEVGVRYLAMVFVALVTVGMPCAFRTEIALTDADHAQMGAIMASGAASAEAERAAIGRTEAWFERRIGPITGTAQRVARASPLNSGAFNRGQFDCIDTTHNTNSLLLVLDQLKLLQHHTIAAPVARFPPHNTAVIRDRKSNELWTVDPWTHKSGEVPDIFPLAKWKAGEVRP